MLGLEQKARKLASIFRENNSQRDISEVVSQLDQPIEVPSDNMSRSFGQQLGPVKLDNLSPLLESIYLVLDDADTRSEYKEEYPFNRVFETEFNRDPKLVI